MFVERLPALPPTLADFSPAPPAGDRHGWAALPEPVRIQLLARGQEALDSEWPPLPATAYLDYARTGDRVRFEQRYFTRRRQLNALVLAECVEGRGRFMDAIVDGIFSLCEESGWQLPAHNAHARGGPRLPLPDTSAPVVDLFAAETGAQLAVLAAVLGAQLDAVSPEIVHRIDRELRSRVIEPYLTRHFWWMGRGDERMNNWTAWCTQNVLATVFTRPIDQATRRAAVEKAAGSLDAFLKDYGEDGACEEGALYYHHAGLCLFNALAILDAAAPGTFGPLWREPKLRNIAEYILNVHVDGEHYFNFADCSAVVERCGAREHLFGLAVGSDALADFAAADWAAQGAPDLPEEINLLHRLQAAFTAPALAARKAGPPRKWDTYYPSIGLLIARDSRYALAVKAGDNGDSHNHNDVGSFILYKDGRPFIVDVGVGSYTARTFSPQRYDIWTMQSAFHNLPTFGGVMQQDGERFAARDVEVVLREDEARISMELAGAYPPEAAVRSYRRHVRLCKGKAVEIEDVHEGDRAAELSLMLCARPALSADRIRIEELGEIGLSGNGTLRLEEIPIDDPRLRAAWPDRLYRVLVPLAGQRLLLTIA